MKNKKTFFSILIVILTTVFFVVSSQRRNIASWALQKYFAEHGVKAQFEVNSFGYSGLSLTKLNLDEKVFVEDVQIKLASANFDLLKLKALSFKMDLLDTKEVRKVLQKLSGKSSSTEGLSYEIFRNLCQILEPISLDVSIDQFFLKGKKTPLGLKLHREADSSETVFSFKGHVESSPLPETIEMSEMNYHGESKLICGDEEIKIDFAELDFDLSNGVMAKSNYNLKKIDAHFKKAEIKVLPNQMIHMQLPGPVDLEIEHKKKKFWDLRATSVHVISESKLSQLLSGEFQLKLIETQMRAPVNMRADTFEVRFKKDHEIFPIKGDVKVSGLDYQDVQEKNLLSGISLEGPFELTKNYYKTQLQISDTQSVLNFSALHISRDTKNKWTDFKFEGKKNFLLLNDEISNLLPPLSQWKIKGDGKIKVSGEMRWNKGQGRGSLLFSGQSIDLNSKYGEAKKLDLKYNLRRYPLLSSAPENFLRAHHAAYGPSVEKFNWVYKVDSLSKIKVKELDFEYEGARIQVKPFVLDAKNKKVIGFDAQVTNLELKKVLKMALKDTVEAEGILDGSLRIQYKGKTPLFSGHLKTRGEGWIRYRKPGAIPQTSFSGNPMHILEGYLYDFYYKNLDIDYESDTNYDMKMTLSTLGSNPQYLEGKPLKLNVNLEQNLLAAFKAMMLTYDMPNRLKDKIEKMGNK